jgi:putative aminopeptidase FrvX
MAQDVAYVKEMIDSLCAPRYHGRGYVSDGDVKAAQFLKRQCEALNLAPLNESYLQPFDLGVNTFPGAMELEVNGTLLKTGEDYIIEPRSLGQEGAFKAFNLKKRHVKSKEKLFKLSQKEKVNNAVIVLDVQEEDIAYQSFIARVYENPLNAKAYLVKTNKKLTWSVGRSMLGTTVFQVKSERLKKKVKQVELDVDQVWNSNHRSYNVMAQIPGKKNKTIVYTAHYDHLGRMGADTYIPGASDNASGTAMLLDLARHYKDNPPDYNVVFLWFGGEEAGLVGSKYFVENSPLELQDIDFLINLDLMADAATGITAVNGKIYNAAFERLAQLNEQVSQLSAVKARGSAANSDHYPFFEKGVPSFFIYTMGDYKHYHDIHDRPENIPLTNYEQVFALIQAFADAMVKD